MVFIIDLIKNQITIMKSGKILLIMNYLLTLWSIINYVIYFNSVRRFSFFNSIQNFTEYPLTIKITFIHLQSLVLLFFILFTKMINEKSGFLSDRITQSSLSQSLSRLVNYKGFEMKYYQQLFLGSLLIYFVGLQFVSELNSDLREWYLIIILLLTLPQYFLMKRFLAISFFEDISSTLDTLFLLSFFFLFLSFFVNDNEGFIFIGLLLIFLSLFISILRAKYKREGILGDKNFKNKERANYPFLSMIVITFLQLITLNRTYSDLNSEYWQGETPFFEIALYLLATIVIIGLIEFLADRMDINKLKKYFSVSVTITALLIASFFIIDDLWFAVNYLFDVLKIFGDFVLFILPTGIATGLELAIIKRKKEL